jgi:aarF domain-containing kinase
LSPLAFVDLSEHTSGDEKTGEERMLEASRKELNEQVPKRLRNSHKVRKGVYFFLCTYVWEPICTGLRFLHLAVLFLPVIVTAPAVWIGPRDPKRDNERKGTLWWYNYLVWSMEKAGAAFIKVRNFVVQS